MTSRGGGGQVGALLERGPLAPPIGRACAHTHAAAVHDLQTAYFIVPVELTSCSVASGSVALS
jgi:hypothetical protein